MSWQVSPEWDGERADKVLAHLSGRSRSSARLALEDGTVLLNGEPVEPRHKVRIGGEFIGTIPNTHTPLEPEPIPFEVVFEDEHVAVIDKPTGIVTHPGAGRRGGTLAGGL